MLNALMQPGIPLADAAAVAGLPEVKLRAWLDSGQVRLAADAGRPKRDGRRLAVVDILRVAIIARVTAYGLAPATAADIVDDAFGARLRAAGEQNEPEAQAIVLARAVGDAQIVFSGDANAVVVRGGDVQKKGPETADFADFVTVRVGAIARAVLQRLEDRLPVA